ncbi:MAG: MBL fold metallo-hydrolase [Bacteroidota bacterium]|nr:MBL fold metallo-hydrolase [Bacteroidota bacterium]
MHIKTFVFNSFQVNTYLLYDDNKAGIVIDPAMMFPEEHHEFKTYLETHGIKLKKALFTHGHIDHIAGAAWVKKEFGLSPTAHAADNALINAAEMHAEAFGIKIDPPADVKYKLEHGDVIQSGDITLHCRLVPGHSPGSIAFIEKETKSIFTGDALFAGSIGRTDLPGGDYDTLIHSIQEQLMSLPSDYTIHPGHGPKSTIQNEKTGNPYLS